MDMGIKLFQGYIAELTEQGFETVFFDDADEAVRYIVSERGKRLSLVIWEMAMLPGKIFDSRRFIIEGGFNTGKYFHAFFREKLPTCPGLLYTDHRDIIPEWNEPNARDFALAKREYNTKRFATMVKMFVCS